MGALFSKKRESRVTEQDRAVLRLKSQRDELKRNARRVEANLERERQLAKQLIAKGQTDRAKLMLKKKRCQEQLLRRTEEILDNIETMTYSLEFSQLEMKVLDGLKEGNAALKQMHELVTVSDVERIMMETEEGIEKQKEIDGLLSGQLSDLDEEAVAGELEVLLAMEAGTLAETPRLPSVPETPLPSVPEAASSQLEDAANLGETPERVSSRKNKQAVALPA